MELPEELATRAIFDGSLTSTSAGLKVAIPRLAEGVHTASVTVSDRAGRRSAARTLNFGVDRSLPSVSMLDAAGLTLRQQGQILTVEIIASDAVSGLDRVEVYLDYGDEFSSRKLACLGEFEGNFPGPWYIGLGRHSVCKVKLDRLGFHTLTAVAIDQAANRALSAARQVYVQPAPGVIASPSK